MVYQCQKTKIGGKKSKLEQIKYSSKEKTLIVTKEEDF
jgi:hypothetical protein